MLTHRQRQALDFIISYRRLNGISPTYPEICAGIGNNSRSSICRMMDALEERGFIRKFHHVARSIIVLDRPAGPCAERPLSDAVARHQALKGAIPIYRSGDHRIMGYLPEVWANG